MHSKNNEAWFFMQKSTAALTSSLLKYLPFSAQLLSPSPFMPNLGKHCALEVGRAAVSVLRLVV